MPGTPAAQCDYDIVAVAMNTVTGTQDIVGNCGGKTPKGGVIISTRATATNTNTNGASISVSVWDSSGNVRLVSNMSETGALIASYTTGRRHSNSTIVHALTTTSEALDGSATFSSVSANTLTINVTDAPATAVLLTVWMFYGDSLDAFVGEVVGSATADAEVTETGIPFAPTALIAIAAAGGFNAAPASSARHSVGFVAFNDDDTVQGQAGMSMFDRNEPNVSSATGGGFRTDSFVQRIIVSVGGTLSEDARYEATGRTSDGFKVTTRGTAGVGTATAIGYLAIRTGKLRAWVGNPSFDLMNTGDKSITSTGPGFRPRAVFCLGSRQVTNNVYVEDSQALHYGIGGAVSPSTQASGCYHALDQSAPTSITRCRLSTSLMTIASTVGSGSVDWSASLVSFDSQPAGFTVNVDVASGAERQVGILAFEAGAIPQWFDARAGHRWRRCLARR